MEIDYTALVPFVIALVRNVLGWAENALEDKKVTKYELTKLGKTVLRIGFVAGIFYYGLNQGLVESSSMAAFVDFAGMKTGKALERALGEIVKG